jgi:hypothetical protein
MMYFKGMRILPKPVRETLTFNDEIGNENSEEVRSGKMGGRKSNPFGNPQRASASRSHFQ